jgi:hypothetical protein
MEQTTLHACCRHRLKTVLSRLTGVLTDELCFLHRLLLGLVLGEPLNKCNSLGVSAFVCLFVACWVKIEKGSERQ